MCGESIKLNRNSKSNRTQSKSNRNGSKDAYMLDIVVGIKSNLIRNPIILKSSFIEIEISKIVAKLSKRNFLIEQDH
ncbi:hypothetical protein Hdeb2414_s0024g00646851 [Helianthus debilis subsp. tardiflorus]